MGADFIIAVDVTTDKAERAAYFTKHSEKEPGLLQVVLQAIYISSYYSAHALSEGADEVVHPKLAHIFPNEFHRARELILEGELATVDTVAKIKRHLAAAGIPLKPKSHSI